MLDIDRAYHNNRIALDQIRRISLGWAQTDSASKVGISLMEEQAALDELAKLRQAANLVIAQFSEIGDANWPTRGMKTAIDALEDAI